VKERVTHVHTPPGDIPALARAPRPAGPSGLRKLAAPRTGRPPAGGAAAGATAAAMLVTGGAASAAPTPTISQVQAKLSQLNAKASKLDQQLDQAQQQLQAANQRLGVVNSQVTRFTTQFNAMRSQIGRIAAQAYMQGQVNSSIELLTTGKPQQILDESSILLELSSSNNAQMDQFLAAARRLDGAQQAALHTQQGIAGLRKSLTGQKTTLSKLISQQSTLLAKLTPAQAVGLGPGGGGGGGGAGNPAPVKYTGPTATQAEKAVAFAYAQLGCPYVFGGTGPCSSGFDCSGLTSQAWASAGVSIGRTTYDQATLPHVSISALEPGDILEFAGDSHVGLYVGGGFMIDAPHTGLDVEKVALTGWYKTELDFAVRP
jgi:cell wall-associated NlpC family hydrolase/outer membrane murein-binding lipoprotein Lpp